MNDQWGEEDVIVLGFWGFLAPMRGWSLVRGGRRGGVDAVDDWRPCGRKRWEAGAVGVVAGGG